MTDDATAAPVEGQAADVPGDNPAPAASWMDSLGDDQKGYVENKGWKDPAEVLSSYQNLEKLRGVPEEQLLRWPDNPDDPEAMAPVYAKMGRPEAPDQYTNILGDGFDDGVFAAAAAQAFDVGVGDVQFQAMQKVMAEQAQALQEAQDTQSAEAFDAWKNGDQEGFNNAAKLMADMGVNEESLEGILSGDRTQLYDFLAKVAKNSGESKIIHGETSEGEGFAMSPSSAKSKIDELMNDKEFIKTYTSDNERIRKPAMERMNKLHEIAARA